MFSTKNYQNVTEEVVQQLEQQARDLEQVKGAFVKADQAAARAATARNALYGKQDTTGTVSGTPTLDATSYKYRR